MQFLNPAVLLGLVAAALPLAIHLLHRGRTQPHPFSDFTFLRQLQQNRMRRLQLRQWLVLLLRTLIIALIVCAFARPTYQAGRGWGGGDSPVAVHALLDLSYSTRYQRPAGSLFDQLQRQLGDLLAVLPPRDLVTVQPFAQRPHPPFAGDRTYLAERMAELAPTQAATDLRAALHAVAQHLNQESALAAHELFIFTDLAEYNWDQLDDALPSFAGTRVYIAGPHTQPRPNAYVKRVAAPSWMLAADAKVTLRADIAHSGAGTALDLFVDGQRTRRHSVDPGAPGTTQVALSFSPRRPGRLSGHIALADDALALDNRRYFTLDLPTAITALLFGERPEDAYYARRALGAAALSDPVVEIRTGLFADLDASALAGVDVLVLCNLARLGAAQKAALDEFVAGGGGVVLFPAPHSDLGYYNRDLLTGLTPGRFKDRVGTPGNTAAYQVLDEDGPHHPLFNDLLTSDSDQPRFYAYFSLVPAPDLLPLARFGDGQLAMALAWQEQGRVALAAFPIDPQWNDLHRRGLFAPLLHRLVRELSLPPDRHATYLVGETVYRRLADVPMEAVVEAETPSGERLRLGPERVGGQYLWKIPRVGEAGIWYLRAAGATVDAFAVNLDARESALAPVAPERVRRVFPGAEVHFLHPGDDLRLAVLGNRHGRELWRECLLLALGLLLVEQWIARAPRDSPARQAA